MYTYVSDRERDRGWECVVSIKREREKEKARTR